MQAFSQVELPDPVFMFLLQGWQISLDSTLQSHSLTRHHDTKHFIRLHQNLHGCNQAVHKWFQHLNKGIISEGVTQSKVRTIKELITNLSKVFLLEDQGSVQDYLGIAICNYPNAKTITTTQSGLIESFITDTGLTFQSNTKTTTSVSILHSDTGGLSWQDTWNYLSPIKKLSFLAQNSWPDISFAMHQPMCMPLSGTYHSAWTCSQRYHLLSYFYKR